MGKRKGATGRITNPLVALSSAAVLTIYSAGYLRTRAAAEKIQAADRSRVVVGVNRFTLDTEDPYEPLRVDPAIEAAQASRLAELRASREAGAVERALSALRKAAEGTDNVLPPMKEALKARATVGEVCDALREVWGTYQPVERF